MSDKLGFNAETFARLHGIAVIVSKVLPENQIVIRAPKPKMAGGTLASYYLSIWYLDTGKVHGDCDITKATEIHMSPKRYKQLQEMAEVKL